MGSSLGAPTPIRRDALRVWCAERQNPAVISTVERDTPRGRVHYVLWCSLRACDACSEQCLLGCAGREAGVDDV
jgi:hypothetical protein